jgi:hypothetical protein
MTILNRTALRGALDLKDYVNQYTDSPRIDSK